MLEMDELDIQRRAYPSSPFSNGFEAENWQGPWCGTCRHDEDNGGTGNCPLLNVAIIEGVTPREWREVALGGLANRYECEKYEVRDGEDDARADLPDRQSAEPIWSPPEMDH